jgi:hypothetical protein
VDSRSVSGQRGTSSHIAAVVAEGPGKMSILLGQHLVVEESERVKASISYGFCLTPLFPIITIY